MHTEEYQLGSEVQSIFFCLNITLWQEFPVDGSRAYQNTLESSAEDSYVGTLCEPRICRKPFLKTPSNIHDQMQQKLTVPMHSLDTHPATL